MSEQVRLEQFIIDLYSLARQREIALLKVCPSDPVVQSAILCIGFSETVEEMAVRYGVSEDVLSKSSIL